MMEPRPTRVLYTTFLGLLILTITTVAVSFIDLGNFNVAVALAIAFAKAAVVVMIFMDGSRANSLIRITVLAGLFWLAILLFFLFSDYLTRLWISTPTGGL